MGPRPRALGLGWGKPNRWLTWVGQLLTSPRPDAPPSPETPIKCSGVPSLSALPQPCTQLLHCRCYRVPCILLHGSLNPLFVDLLAPEMATGSRPSSSQVVGPGLVFLTSHLSPLPVAKPHWVLPTQGQRGRAGRVWEVLRVFWSGWIGGRVEGCKMQVGMLSQPCASSSVK